MGVLMQRTMGQHPLFAHIIVCKIATAPLRLGHFSASAQVVLTIPMQGQESSNSLFDRRLIIMKSSLGGAVLATVLSLFSASAAQATPNHSFTITNNTSLTLWFSQVQGMCVAGYSGFTDIPPHSTITISWIDSNNIVTGCTDREKFIAFNYSGTDWQGWLGMVHRKIEGDWYNGQFYAAKITASSSSYTFSDGDEPPEWINPVCSHTDTGCFGPFSEMVDDDKTGYNWQLLYKAETGYDFQYNK